MHIGFRTSGGRGEYEVVGSHSSFSPLSLEGFTFKMRWPDGIVRDTGLWLDPADSGKARLRSMLTPQIQIGRIVAPMMLLPDATRAFRGTPVDLPIARSKQYTVTEVGFGSESEFSGNAELVTFVPSFITIANQGNSDDVGVSARWERVTAVYSAAGSLPAGLQQLVKQHQDYLASGQVVDGKLTTVVSNIIKQLAASPTAAPYVDGTDPLPALERMLGVQPKPGPTLPPPDELGEDAPEVSARSAHQYRLAKSRGLSGQKFSAAVRAAYNHRCAMCGAIFGAVPGVRSGIDAAHILAWSKHDLDIVQNGIALCKLHHWAFDAGIVMPVHDGGAYRIRFTTLADLLEPESVARIGVEDAPILEEWLPENPALRPSPKYLQRLYADLGVTFRGDT